MSTAIARSGFGKWLAKSGGVFPNVLEIAARVALGHVQETLDGLTNILRMQVEGNSDARLLLQELEAHRTEWQDELERINRDEASIGPTPRQRDIAQPILALVAVLAFTFLMYVLAYRTIPEANRELFIHLMGIVEGGMVTLVFQYYFGSSIGSRKKTELLDNR
jgi:hypothetical protein